MLTQTFIRYQSISKRDETAIYNMLKNNVRMTL